MQNSREVYKGDKGTSFKDSIDAAYARFTRLEFGSSKEKDTTEFLRHIAMTADMNYGYAAVSESFVDANKTSVIFLPVDLRGSPGLQPIVWAGGRVEDTDEKKMLRASFIFEKFDTTLLLNLTQLEKVLRWCDKVINEENYYLIRAKYYDAVFTFFSNLELYKLTCRDDAVIYRYAASDEEENIPPEKRDKYGDWVARSPEAVLRVAEYKVATHWFRKDAVSGMQNGYLGKLHVRRSTIGNAKKTHYIALDTAEIQALVLIKKD